MKAGNYPSGIRCRHKSKPAEPFAKEREFGSILRITPSSGGNPAQGYVEWDGYFTWERLQDLEFSHVRERREDGE